MPDVFSKAKRSEVMSRIRGKGNKDTELALMRFFRLNGFIGWRRHQPVFGKPDFIFPKCRVAIFVDGCFWHGCPTHSKIPQQNRAFWAQKLQENKSRDKLVVRTLKASGWRVLRIWEHDLDRRRQGRLIARILKALSNRGRKGSVRVPEIMAP